MLWVTWTITPLVTSLVLFFCAFVIWATDPKATRFNLLTALLCLVLGLSIAPDHATAAFDFLYGLATTVIDDWRLDNFTLSHANMLVTGAAFFWIVRRALQTLWKPVPELIDILGVEVPLPPDVSLTAIGADKATITWTHPPPSRPVVKYVIQVNGVNVGESATSRDTLITVSGLKPDHFYNVRIIAVGSNNFQAGSRVLRLRTFSEDGKPCLGNSRLPSSFTESDPPSRPPEPATGDENGSTPVKQVITSTFGVAPETSQSSTNLRDGNSAAGNAHGNGHASRRNTVNRRHPPSTANGDPQQQQQHGAGGSSGTGHRSGKGKGKSGGAKEEELTEAQMAALNKKYLDLRRETEETTALIAKEEEDTKKLLDEYEAEKQEKRREHKRKDEQTEKLKREQGATERAMRAVLQRKAQREKKLKEKKAEIDRLRDDIAKWEEGIQKMKEDRDTYNQQRTDLEEERQKRGNELRETNAQAQAECSQLEAELKERRQLVKELEDARKNQVSNGDDAEWQESIAELKRDWQRSEAQYRAILMHEMKRQNGLDNHINIVSAQLQQIPQKYSQSPYMAYDPAQPGSSAAAAAAAAAAASTGGIASTPHPLTQPPVSTISGPSLPALSTTSPAPPLTSMPMTTLPLMSSAQTGYDYELASQNLVKRRSRASNSMSNLPVPSPVPAYSMLDGSSSALPNTTSPFPSIVRPATQSGGFLTGPFMGPPADHPGPGDASSKTLAAAAPLSPSAASLLPSNIFTDDEPMDPMAQTEYFQQGRLSSPFVPLHTGSPDLLANLDGSGAFAGDTMNGSADGGHDMDSNSNGNSNSNSTSSGTGNGKANGTATTAIVSNIVNNLVNGHANGNGNAMASSSSPILGSMGAGATNNDPQSPASSNRSMSIMSSPRGSSQFLPFQSYGITNDEGQPLNGALPSPAVSSPPHGPAPTNARFGIFSFPRSRTTKAVDEEGPALGSLKHGQSQSFPRQGEDADASNKSRRISLSSWSVFNRNSVGPEMLDGHYSGATADLKVGGFAGFSARSLFPFSSRTNGLVPNGAPVSPRPSSVASTDMPRPSTDSGSIWGPPGLDSMPNGTGLAKAARLWPGDVTWSSRNPSRRPSMHGSPSALKTNLASAEDEILDEEELLNPETSPSQVGVIGSRPPASSASKKTSTLGKALNPAAPTFMANIFRARSDKDSKPKSKKGRDKGDKGDKGDKDKDKDRDQEDVARSEATALSSSLSVAEDSPYGSRRLSRDGHSLRTQTSVSESRTSLEYTVSNATSEGNNVAILSSSRESGEHSLLKLFKKESTGKLSFTRRMGRSSKGSGSVANSDKNASIGRSSFGDLDDVTAAATAAAASSTSIAGEATRCSTATSAGTSFDGGLDSSISSPSLGPLRARGDKTDKADKSEKSEKSESKLRSSASWFSIKKKNRDTSSNYSNKESLETDRDRALETASVASSSVAPSVAATDDGDRRL